LDLLDGGARYRDIAVLVRTRAAYPRLREAFASFDIPVQPGGRTALFDQPEAVLLGKTICWLVNLEWRGTYGSGEQVTDEALLARYQELFRLDNAARNRLAKLLLSWKAAAANTARPADLVGELYELLGALKVGAWDLNEPMYLNKLGTLARFSALLADYESVRRRARPDAENAGEQVGGQDRGRWCRFPTSGTGQAEHWVLPRNRFDAARYEGSDADERRLFYVAITRARDWLSVSRHHRRLEDLSLALPPEDIRVPAPRGQGRRRPAHLVHLQRAG
jgi:DNA helicase-2/ATP-dependent DNA helicase PcrA